MSYVKNLDRDHLDGGGKVETARELAYLITKKIDSYLNHKGLNYASLNESIGVLECAKPGVTTSSLRNPNILRSPRMGIFAPPDSSKIFATVNAGGDYF